MNTIDKKQVVDELRKFAVSKDAEAFDVGESLKTGNLSIYVHFNKKLYAANVFTNFIATFGEFGNQTFQSLEEFTNHLKTL